MGILRTTILGRSVRLLAHKPTPAFKSLSAEEVREFGKGYEHFNKHARELVRFNCSKAAKGMEHISRELGSATPKNGWSSPLLKDQVRGIQSLLGDAAYMCLGLARCNGYSLVGGKRLSAFPLNTEMPPMGGNGYAKGLCEAIRQKRDVGIDLPDPSDAGKGPLTQDEFWAVGQLALGLKANQTGEEIAHHANWLFCAGVLAELDVWAAREREPDHVSQPFKTRRGFVTKYLHVYEKRMQSALGVMARARDLDVQSYMQDYYAYGPEPYSEEHPQRDFVEVMKALPPGVPMWIKKDTFDHAKIGVVLPF